MRIPTRKYEVSARGWNGFVDRFFRGRILQVLRAQRSEWRHPWSMTVRWSPLLERWTVAILPGVCVSATSDGDPVVRVSERGTSAETRARLGLAPETESEARVDAYLSESPEVEIAADLWRAIGTDAAAVSGDLSEAVPPFFTRRGVQGPAVLDTGGGTEVVIRLEGIVADRASARLLRAVDVVLSHERSATVVAVDRDEATADEVSVNFSLDDSGREAEPQVSVVRKWEPPVRPELLELIEGATDTVTDETRLATIYLLSRPGEAPGAEPDGTWQAFVRYTASGFWNLQYQTKFAVETVEPTRVAVPLPDLGQGELGRFGDRLTAGINQEIASLEAALATVQNEGRFLML